MTIQSFRSRAALLLTAAVFAAGAAGCSSSHPSPPEGQSAGPALSVTGGAAPVTAPALASVCTGSGATRSCQFAAGREAAVHAAPTTVLHLSAVGFSHFSATVTTAPAAGTITADGDQLVLKAVAPGTYQTVIVAGPDAWRLAVTVTS